MVAFTSRRLYRTVWEVLSELTEVELHGTSKKNKDAEALAQSEMGFQRYRRKSLAVAQKVIRDYVIGGGGFMFAMCSATDSFDIALSAEGVSTYANPCLMVTAPREPNYQANKLDYKRQTFAFKDYQLETKSLEVYEFSAIDTDAQNDKAVQERTGLL